MGTINALVHSFSTGEVSTAGLARIDQERLRLAAEIQENLLPHVIGKGQVRPGTQYLTTTDGNAKTRLIPFVFDVDDSQMLGLSDLSIRFLVDDVWLTRAAVTSTVGDGDFSASGSWTKAATDGCTATISGGKLTLSAAARGGSTYCKQQVTTTSAGTEHALRITVDQGSVLFRCGSTDGGDDYITETTLGHGTHSLAFTPSGSYWIKFFTRSDLVAIVDSCTVEAAGVVEITAPWSEAELPLIRVDQSGSVIFMTGGDWQQRKLERRASGQSWSVVTYEATDGPFVTSSTNNIFITPGAGYSLTTLTASEALFKTTHVGALVRIFTTGYSTPFVLGGADSYSEPIRVFGVAPDTAVDYSVSGTFVANVILQRSFTSQDTGFFDAVTMTIPTTGTVAAVASYNNVEHWYRMGIKSGGYTSGTVAVAFNFSGGGDYGVYRIVGYTSPTQVSVQTLKAPSSLTASKDWKLGAWSDENGFPTAVGFFDGRLFWGGTDKFWGSESDAYYTFTLDNDGAAGSIQRAVATGGGVKKVNWIMPLQRMIMGTSSSEVSARSSSFDEPLTPTNITLKDASTQGVARVSPAKLDRRGIFVHRDGTRAYEIVYDVDSQDYSSNNLMQLNEDIGSTGLLEVATQRAPESYVWFVRGDGQCCVLLHDQREKTSGWFRFISAPTSAAAAVIESVAVVPSDAGPDRVYFVIKRTVNGNVVRYVEKLAKHTEARGAAVNHMADSYVYNAGPVTTFTGLSHLEGETVVAWGTIGGISGQIGTTFTVASGQITLPAAYTSVTVGLSYNWRYKSARLAYAAEKGTALLAEKRVAQVGILAQNMMPDAVEYGPDFNTTYPLPRTEGGQDVVSTTLYETYDEPLTSFGGGWNTDSRVCLKGSSPLPATLLGLVIGIETHED